MDHLIDAWSRSDVPNPHGVLPRHDVDSTQHLLAPAARKGSRIIVPQSTSSQYCRHVTAVNETPYVHLILIYSSSDYDLHLVILRWARPLLFQPLINHNATMRSFPLVVIPRVPRVSTVSLATQERPAPTHNSSEPAAPEPHRLQAMLSPSLALRWHHIAVAALFGFFFLYLNYTPLFHSDIWSHVSYGNWMLDQGVIPGHDPFMPLAEGMKIIDTAWLSQIIFAAAERAAGPEALSSLFAAVVLLTYLVLARIFYLQTGRLSLSVIGAFTVLALGWTRHAVIRPEIFGGLCFALLLWIVTVTNKKPSRWAVPWIGTPVLFALWVNLHGSFAVGLALLGCLCLGSAIRTFFSSRSLRKVFDDIQFRRSLMVGQLALAACLLNPYGIGLIIETFSFSGNANLKDVVEWFPMSLTGIEGITFAAAMALIAVLLRHSRRAIHPTEVLLIVLFSAAAASSVRMIGWFAPVVMFVVMPHIGRIADHLFAATSKTTDNTTDNTTDISPLACEGQLPPGRSFSYSLVCLLVIWICFALSPTGGWVLNGKSRKTDRLYSGFTPTGVSNHLREHPPQGLVWSPQWWGDWLVWDGPAGTPMFMTTQLHLAPHRVWQDYMRIARGDTGWQRALDRYGVQTLVVHKQLQPQLTRSVRRQTDWQIVYEDNQGIVLERKTLANNSKPYSKQLARS